MDKKDIYKLVYDTNTPYRDLPKIIPIEDFVGGGLSILKGKRITYGVNVYTGEETDTSVIPFNYNNSGFEAKEIAEKVTSGYTIPDFLNQFDIQEIMFRVDFIKDKGLINIEKIKVTRYYEKNPSQINNLNTNQIANKLKNDFFNKNPHTFLQENLLALFSSLQPSTQTIKANVWVRGEDPDVTTGKYLAHFLAISDADSTFYNFIDFLKMNIMELVIMLKSRRIYDEKDKCRKEAIKSAKAAIMSRNMSHNLGSHVMSYLKANLGSVKSILKDNVLSILLKDQKLNPELFSEQQLSTNNLTLPFLVGLGRFISYLQERQDYIATVSTDYIPYCSSVNFKDFIFDELNSDKRYERHPDRTNLKPDNILLGNIARSEGLGRQTSPTKKNGQSLCDIVLKFRSRFDGTPPGDDQVAQVELDQIRSFELSLPGGIVGRQAIFSIIENVIRNAAKHGNWREQGKLELTLDIFTKEEVADKQPSDELKKRLRIDDQAEDDSLSLKGVLEKFYNGENSNDYYIITLTDNLVSSPNSLKELRKALHEDYVRIDNRMIETNKGIKEMRISAAWLRSLGNDLELSPFDESNDGKGEKEWSDTQLNWDKQPPVLYIRLSKGLHNQCHLQYIFCIMRPKKVAFVSSSFANRNLKTNNINGCFFLSPDEYMKFPNKNFEYIVYDDELKNTYKKNYEKYEKYQFEQKSDIKNFLNSKNLFKLFKDRFETEKTWYEKVRRHSSQRFILLSNLSNEKKVIKDIKTLVFDINRIKHQIENNNKRIEETTEETEKSVIKKLIKELTEIINRKTEELKRKTEEVYFHLYRQLSKWDEKEKILIADDTQDKSLSDEEKKSKSEDDAQASAQDNKDECKNKIEKTLSSEKLTYNPDDKNIKYRYIKHLEEKIEFDKYVLQDDTQYDFSEGITGDNSTDRLVRKEPKTELWFFKQLHAMKQQVAVIDERIFSKVTGLDESDFVIRKAPWGKYLEEDKVSLITQNKLSKQDAAIINVFNNHERLEEFIKNKNLKHPDVSYINLIFYSKDAQNHLGATYKYKNLHVFSIIHSVEDPKCFNLYGIKIDKSMSAFSQCVRYATLWWNSDEGRLIIENDEQQKTEWMKFHSLSIHQGLLDKMYDTFRIKKDDIDSKEKLTKVFYEHFIIDAKAQEIPFKDEKNKQHFFLPGMTIHSGRSKPSKEDMPQQLPFIPYSAIEHAVLDCKYSIVELLDSARYE